MTEAEQRRQESPLLSDHGVTTIKDTVVARIAGMAAGEVEGVHMGGGVSRSAGGLLEGITGSDSPTRGVSVEVGSVEAAIDLKMGIDYGKNILGTVGEVRQKITERVQTITGLKVTELNVTISDVVFPENGQDSTGSNDSRSGARTGPETRTIPRRELRTGASERETTEVEPRSRTYTEGSSGPVPEENVRAEGTPLEEDETRRLRVGDEEPSGEGTGTSTSGTAATSGGETSEEYADGSTQEIDRGRVSEAEERRTRRRRRREERGEDEEG